LLALKAAGYTDVINGGGYNYVDDRAAMESMCTAFSFLSCDAEHLHSKMSLVSARTLTGTNMDSVAILRMNSIAALQMNSADEFRRNTADGAMSCHDLSLTMNSSAPHHYVIPAFNV
jgi:hypothetical protein